jgi:hypothetical protein
MKSKLVDIAQEHPFKEIRTRQISYDGMAAGNLEGVEIFAFRRNDGCATHWLRRASVTAAEA